MTAGPESASARGPSSRTLILALLLVAAVVAAVPWLVTRTGRLDTMRATLTWASPEFTRPAYSSIRLGLVPTAWATVGAGMSVGIGGPDSSFRADLQSYRASAGLPTRTLSGHRMRRRRSAGPHSAARPATNGATGSTPRARR